MDTCIRCTGQHRGAPRIYLDSQALSRAGFLPGTFYRVAIDSHRGLVTLRLDPTGDRKVSRKAKSGGIVPVLDINSRVDLKPLAGLRSVRVVFTAGLIHILALASQRKAARRLDRLQARLEAREGLRLGSLSFGAGVASWALHEGLAAAGVDAELVVANEIEGAYLDLAARNHPHVTAHTSLLAAPMQEVAADDWLLARLRDIDVLEVGIPCSGASKAGRAKRGLARPEDHPHVGHLVATLIVLLARWQPAILVLENVRDFAVSAGAEILRKWLRDAAYTVSEVVLDAGTFGSLEGRVRWFLVAHPPEIQLDLQALVAATPPAGRHESHPVLQDVLEIVPNDDERWRGVEYLHAKAARDAEGGKCFAMQFMRPTDRLIPTLRKGYAKGGSTDPRLVHPSDPAKSRLLTVGEHAAIKGVDRRLVDGTSQTLGHQVLGQSVDARCVKAIGQALGAALRRAQREGLRGGACTPRRTAAIVSDTDVTTVCA